MLKQGMHTQSAVSSQWSCSVLGRIASMQRGVEVDKFAASADAGEAAIIGGYTSTHTRLTLKAYRVLDGGRDLVEKVKLHSRP